MIRLGCILAICLGFAGCDDRLHLQSVEGDVSLTYSCSNIQSTAVAANELDLLDEMAMTAYRHSMGKGKTSEAAHLPLLQAERRRGELERAVVEYFCANRDALAVERVPIVRSPVTVGSMAPEFRLPALVEGDGGKISEGDSVSLTSHRGNVVVLHMLATWCPPCQIEHQELIEYVPQAPPGVEILTIVTHDPAQMAIEWLRDNGGLPFTTLVDHRDRMANRYGIRGFPQMYVVDADGRVAYHSRGSTSIAQLRQVLESVLEP